MKRYASIRFDRAIGPVNAAGAFVDAIVAGDAYLITRKGDDVTVTEVASGIVLEVPWSRVISGSPMPDGPQSEEMRAITERFDGPPRCTHEGIGLPGCTICDPLARPRKGGWPKGKPRKPAAEGGEA